MPSNTPRVPKALQPKYNAIRKLTDAFCKEYLNDEYQEVIREVIATLARKRPSPLLRGWEKSWASAIVHAVGSVNFLFDPSQTPHCTTATIHEYFGVSAATSANKSREIRDLLDMGPWSSEWLTASRIDESPLTWMIEIDGFIVDARSLPREIQEVIHEAGLIPYVPEAPDDEPT